MSAAAGVQSRRSPDPERLRADRALARRFADGNDPVGRDDMIERYMPLARSLAARYIRPSEGFDDIFQVACVGLVKAVDRFDPARGLAFASFAVPTITGEIKRYFRDRTWSVHVPRDLQELALKLDRARGELERELARQPTVADLAKRVGVEEEDAVEALVALGGWKAASLDAPVRERDGDSATVGERVPQEDAGFDVAEARADLAHLERILTPRERHALRLRFEEDMTQAEIGQRLGVSQMQVSRILRSAIARLRAHADAPGAAP